MSATDLAILLQRLGTRIALGWLLLVLQLWPGLSAAWRFERVRFEQGAWWQLLSAQWVHLSLTHALANAAALLLIAPLLPALRKKRGFFLGGLGF